MPTRALTTCARSCERGAPHPLPSSCRCNGQPPWRDRLDPRALALADSTRRAAEAGLSGRKVELSGATPGRASPDSHEIRIGNSYRPNRPFGFRRRRARGNRGHLMASLSGYRDGRSRLMSGCQNNRSLAAADTTASLWQAQCCGGLLGLLLPTEVLEPLSDSVVRTRGCLILHSIHTPHATRA
jgi:hypothetical protein